MIELVQLLNCRGLHALFSRTRRLRISHYPSSNWTSQVICASVPCPSAILSQSVKILCRWPIFKDSFVRLLPISCAACMVGFGHLRRAVQWVTALALKDFRTARTDWLTNYWSSLSVCLSVCPYEQKRGWWWWRSSSLTKDTKQLNRDAKR